jgi:hypothetical protein
MQTNDEAFIALTQHWHELTLTDFMFIMKAHDINRAHDAIELIKDAAYREGKRTQNWRNA